MERQLEQVSGTVEHIVFRKEDSGFTVLELDYNGQLLTVVGEMADVEEGETLNITGYYTTHPSFGSQFHADLVERSLPTSCSSIYKYLASGAIKGIGKASAKKIVDRFGRETLTVMEQNPLRLSEVSGITEKKAVDIGKEFQKIYGIRKVMAYLTSFSVRPECIVNAWKKWGQMACDIVAENPYALCDEEIRATFEETELIRREMGLPEDIPCRVRAGVVYVLRRNTGNGHTCLPRQKVLEVAMDLLNLGESQVDVAIDQLCENEMLFMERVSDREFLYLPDYYRAETYVAGRLQMLKRTLPEGERNLEKEIKALEKQLGIQYAQLQKKAIERAVNCPVFVLTGGPGTGKTTTLNAIITLLENDKQRVSIAAPTGRAAKRISELTGHEAKTIHRLLEVDFSEKEKAMKFIHSERSPLKCDVVVIDEMSMVDILLFESLLRALRLGCKLVLVGDCDQLPSVGAGSVLKDLIGCQQFAVVELTEVFRQAAESLIVTNAHRIIQGETPVLNCRTSDFFFLPSPIRRQTAQTTCDLCAVRLPRRYGYSPLWDIQVLCPSRQGELGTVELNQRLQMLLNPPGAGKLEMKSRGLVFREGDKVMQTRNNYDITWSRETGEEGTGVFNGDIGLITKIDKASDCFYVQYEDRIAFYQLELASELEHAYAITVHKSQGSEFEAVIIPLADSHPKLYYRNLLYTAVTRAKKLLILLGRPETIAAMVQNNRKTLRYSNLKALLSEETI